ncbi:MAG: hypothetical protein Fur0037_06670 [Planctomycetota bacterium]
MHHRRHSRHGRPGARKARRRTLTWILGGIAAAALVASAGLGGSAEDPEPWRGRPAWHARLASSEVDLDFERVLTPRERSLAAAQKRASPEAALENLLRQFAQAPKTTRARFVHQIRQCQVEFEPHLLEIVAGEDRSSADLLIPGIEVAGWIRLDPARMDIERHLETGEPAVRAAAVKALARFDYWTEARLTAKLQREEPDVLRALLEVSGFMETPPVEAIAGLLDHEDVAVARAAASALPSSVPATVGLALARIAKEGGERGRIAIEALGGLDPTPERDEALLDLLGESDWNLRHAALSSLEQGEDPIANPGPIHDIVEAEGPSTREQVRALATLEARRSADLSRLLSVEQGLHPVVRLHAARCLVSAGERRGAEILIELLSTARGPGVDDEDELCCRVEARRILTELKGSDLGPDPGPWTNWLQKAEFAPRALETRPRLCW